MACNQLTLSGLCLGEASFGESIATTLLTPLAEGETEISFSPTLMVVLTALVCEYAARVPVSPLQLLRGLSKRLISYSGPRISTVSLLIPLTNFSVASIQEAILLTMIRLAAECQKIPPEPISDVQHLKGISGRHISRVCFFIYASCLALPSYNEKPSEMFSI